MLEENRYEKASLVYDTQQFTNEDCDHIGNLMFGLLFNIFHTVYNDREKGC